MFPRQSAKLIASLSKHVSIPETGVRNIVDLLEVPFAEEKFNIQNWKKHDMMPKTMDENALNWIFLTDTLNFSFWNTDNESRYISYKNKSYSGYWGFCAAINKALQKGILICDPNYYAKISIEELSSILKYDSGDDIPLLEKRHQVLTETGKILLEKYNGKVSTLISECNRSAEKLLKLLAENFPSYKDEAVYKGHKVSFYKRAQIFIGDVWSCFEGTGFGSFHDIDTITVFADYRIPQLLLHFGALKYSDELMDDLINGKEIENGSEKEIEIRGCTIWAAEVICQQLKERMKTEVTVNSILVDYYLWDYRRDHIKETENTPFHKTRCIYY